MLRCDDGDRAVLSMNLSFGVLRTCVLCSVLKCIPNEFASGPTEISKTMRTVQFSFVKHEIRRPALNVCSCQFSVAIIRPKCTFGRDAIIHKHLWCCWCWAMHLQGLEHTHTVCTIRNSCSAECNCVYPVFSIRFPTSSWYISIVIGKCMHESNNRNCSRVYRD